MKNNKMLNDEVMHAFAAEIYDIANRRLNAKHSEKGAEITESLICKQFHNAYMSAKYNPDWEMNTNLLPPEEVLPYLVERYKQQESYIRPRGTAISDDETVHWLRDAENNIEWHYSDLYKKYLMETKKWGTNTVKSMSDDTDGILDLMADPRQTEPFDRRGLVIANVQSGKTANYIGLITKAADAGYHFIIVLAGIHNVLRSQTQQRIEEGFIGFDVDERSRGETAKVGVGEFASYDRSPQAATSRKRDFNKSTKDVLQGVNLQQSKEPIVLVVKKNATILKQVRQWLSKAGADTLATQPLLLIDDEADNASINVKYSRESVSRINEQIRAILSLFSKKAYVGYTATPFANVLIDSRDYDEDLGSDIFPRSFIYTLYASDAYFGAEKVFGDIDEVTPKYYREIQDPPLNSEGKHFKSGEFIESLPDSLKEAVRAFVIACAIRVLRGEKNEHMTMMVNLSPYKSIQQSGRFLLKDYLDDLKEAINSYAQLPAALYASMAPSPLMSELENTWQREYPHDYSWDEVRSTLRETIESLRVAEINSQSKDSLRYDEGPQHVIAIGGYRLSRGLTLEGLMVSYYARNAKAYDALMQMARWFGYRMGYEDLCRVWMTQISAEWYREVASVTDELMDQVDSMLAANVSPMQYGLRIRSNIDVLMITARNKMGAGELMKNAKVLLDGMAVQTAAFNRTESILAQNERLAVNFLAELESAGFTPSLPPAKEEDKGIYLQNIPSQKIIDYIGGYHNSSGSPKTDADYLIQHTHLLEDIGVSKWDVYVAPGKGDFTNDTFTAFGRMLLREQRKPAAETTEDTFYVTKRMLMSRDVESIPLNKQQIKRAKELAERHATDSGKKWDEEKNIPGWCYRRELDVPLLVIHPISMRFKIKPSKRDIDSFQQLAQRGVWPSIDYSETTVGWSISFPQKNIEERVTYTYNDVMMREQYAEISSEEENDAPDE